MLLQSPLETLRRLSGASCSTDGDSGFGRDEERLFEVLFSHSLGQSCVRSLRSHACGTRTRVDEQLGVGARVPALVSRATPAYVALPM